MRAAAAAAATGFHVVAAAAAGPAAQGLADVLPDRLNPSARPSGSGAFGGTGAVEVAAARLTPRGGAALAAGLLGLRLPVRISCRLLRACSMPVHSSLHETLLSSCPVPLNSEALHFDACRSCARTHSSHSIDTSICRAFARWSRSKAARPRSPPVPHPAPPPPCTTPPGRSSRVTTHSLGLPPHPRRSKMRTQHNRMEARLCSKSLQAADTTLQLPTMARMQQMPWQSSRRHQMQIKSRAHSSQAVSRFCFCMASALASCRISLSLRAWHAALLTGQSLCWRRAPAVASAPLSCTLESRYYLRCTMLQPELHVLCAMLSTVPAVT